MRTLARIFAFLCGLYVTAAMAAYQPSAVVNVPTYAAVTGGNFSNTSELRIAEAVTGLGGGGDFTKTTCAPDGGTCLADAAANTFKRIIDNNKPVNLTWWGVSDATSGGCLAAITGCDVSASLTSAFAAALSYGNNVVSTGGRSVVITTFPTIPNNVALTCDGPPGGSLRQNGAAANLFWRRPNSIVLAPTTSITINDNNAFYSCFVRPTWMVPGTISGSGGSFTLPAVTIRDLINEAHNFSGTAINGSGEACNIHDISYVGFDVGTEINGPRCNVSRVIGQNNVDIWEHTVRGGGELHDDDQAAFTSNNYPFRTLDYPITAVGDDGSGGIVITVDPTNIAGGMQIVSGDPLLNSAGQYLYQSSLTKNAFGDVASGSSTINNVIPTGAKASIPTAGQVVTDSAGCLPINTIVMSYEGDENSGTLVVNNNAGCDKMGDRLTLADLSIAPVSLNGSEVVDHVSGNQIYLKGSSLVGPSFDNATWLSGSPVVKVYDPAATNVAVGQNMCASGTPPFCTAPSGWAAGTITSSNIAGLPSGGTGIGNITISGSLTGWASVGVFKVDSEIVGYSETNSTTFHITARGLGGTGIVSHANGSTLTTTPPTVIGIAKTEGAVVLNVPAQSGGTGTVKFLNNPNVVGAIVGQAELTTTYYPYTANLLVGNVYGSAIINPANGTSGGQTLTLAGNANWQRVYEHETVSGTNVDAGTIVDQTPTGNSIHISKPLLGNITGGLVGFGQDGSCGYPGAVTGGTKQWWLGNCPGTGFMIGTTVGATVQGVRMYSNHNFGHRNGLRLYNSPATSATMNVLNSSGKADGFDDEKQAVWIGGNQAQKTQLGFNRATSVLVDSSVGSGSDIAISETQHADNIVIAGGQVNYVAAKQSSVDPDFPLFLQLSTADPSSVTATNLPMYQLTTDSAATTANINCDKSNVFASSSCGVISGETFTPTGASNPTTLADFGDRSLSILDFGAVPDCTTSTTSALAAAETAALAQGVHVIRMDTNATGNCYAIGTHTIPAGITLYCPGPPPAPIASNDYRNAPQRIALTTTAGLSLVGQISNCLIIQKALAIATPPATFQDNYARSLSFTGTGVTVTGENADLRDSMILGFSVGMLTRASRGATFQNLYIDATDCYHFWNQGGGGALMGNNLQCSPYATRFGALAEPSFSLSSITDNGSGVLQAHLTSTCTGTGCPLNGYKVWIGGGANASVQSAQGGWVAANVTSTTIDLQGSTSNFIAGQTESATTTTGSFVVTGITTNIAQVQKTQSITGTCLPAGATIAAVQRDYGIIWLDSAHAATSTGVCTVTITDTAPANVSVSSVAIGNNAGTNYAVGDIVTLVGGTGTAALINIDAVDPTTGAVTALSINDGGFYTVSPGSTNVATSGGSGDGLLTVNISTGATLYGSAVVRTGPAFSFLKITDVRLTNIGDLSHAIGMTFGNSAHSVSVTNCSLHDENVLQDQTHWGIEFASNSNNNKLNHCDSYYFGAAIKSHNIAPSNLPANAVSDSELGGSAGNSGLQNTVLDLSSPTPATNSKSSLTLSGNLSTVFGTLLVMGDERSLNAGLNALSNSTVYYQNSAAQNLTTGCGNSLTAGSSPIYCVAASANITPGALNGIGGTQTLANVSTTYTPYVNGSVVLDTGALTNNRNLTLSNTGATGGYTVTLIRTGSSGGFNRAVYQADGTTLIANVSDGTSAIFVFNPNTSLWVKQ